MPAVSRLGDRNSAGGQLLRGAATVFIDGKPVALHVSPVTPHAPYKPPHLSSVTVGDSEATIFIEGCPPVHIGMQTSCGHPIVEGSETTFL